MHETAPCCALGQCQGSLGHMFGPDPPIRAVFAVQEQVGDRCQCNADPFSGTMVIVACTPQQSGPQYIQTVEAQLCKIAFHLALHASSAVLERGAEDEEELELSTGLSASPRSRERILPRDVGRSY